ncbi:MAG: hypothetical protein ACLSCU_09745 [Eubacterium sp.]
MAARLSDALLALVDNKQLGLVQLSTCLFFRKKSRVWFMMLFAVWEENIDNTGK